MWTIINDCGKQLTVHCKIREKVDNHFKVYEIIEVESDQYKLELIFSNNLAPAEKQHNILNCQQLLQYQFEVEEKEIR